MWKTAEYVGMGMLNKFMLNWIMTWLSRQMLGTLLLLSDWVQTNDPQALNTIFVLYAMATFGRFL